MNIDDLLGLYKAGKLDNEAFKEQLEALKSVELPDLVIDLQREARCGFPEVVYGQNKTAEQILDASKAVLEHAGKLLVTRIDETKSAVVMPELEKLGCIYNQTASIIYKIDEAQPIIGKVLVLGAGTSDQPVAEEAAITCRLFGAEVEYKLDVGVAGLHRLMKLGKTLTDADCIIVCAGMEGALPSVVGGLVSTPVIAVPTSVGYGAAFGGVSALLGMLNSCASGLTVVNIDNGFGAGFAAGRLLNTMKRRES